MIKNEQNSQDRAGRTPVFNGEIMIKPTVGAPVWYWQHFPSDIGAQPMAATITFVCNDRMVNLSVLDHQGKQFSFTSVKLIHGDETYKPVGSYCEWMPHQHHAAKKDDAANDDSLTAELERGTSAAKAMCEHMIAMGAGGAQIPVTHDGRYYVVTVEPKDGPKPKGSAPFYDRSEQFSGQASTGTVKPPLPFPSNLVADAMAVVTQAMRDDDGYLVGWHANIAMAAIDAGCQRDVAQEGAARFLETLSKADVRRTSYFKAVTTEYKNAKRLDEVETKTYPDGTTATGTAPLPDESPTETPTRVTTAMMSDVIVAQDYHILPGTQITMCVLTLRNGTKVLGHNYGSIDQAKQDWLQGRQAAYGMAVDKVWELEGYALRERMHQDSQPAHTDDLQ